MGDTKPQLFSTLSSLLIIVFFSSRSFGNIPIVDTTTKPVVRHAKDSRLPNSIYVKGKIVQISYGFCGMICAGGTVKVKLSQNIKGYRDEFIYLVVPCLERPPVDSVIEVRTTKLYFKEKECYYKSILNHIDSKGLPFYKLNEIEASKIKQVLPTTLSNHEVVQVSW